MTLIIMQRPADKRGLLIPATANDFQELIETLPPGASCAANLTRPRSLKQQRFYWGLLDLAASNHHYYKSSRAIHVFLKLKLGLVESFTFHNGQTHINVGSTSFEKMGGHEFNQYLNSALDLIIQEVLPGVRRADLIREAEKMVGIKWSSLKMEAAA